MNDTEPGLFTKIIRTVFLLVGSILAYIFTVKIFICIWNRHTYLLPGFVALVAGGLIYGGTKQWERWRLVLGRIWLALCGLAFFNSFYYLKLAGLPDLAPTALMGYSNGSIVMGCAALALGIGLIVWQKILDREERGDEATCPLK
jgi:hypothetical protein